MKDLEGFAEPGSEEEKLLQSVDFDRLPRHVAIIMDGNGRWARKRHLPRVAGHRAGIEAVRETVEWSARLGLQVLTLYAFSRENWRRPADEVETLFDLLKIYLRRELPSFQKNNIRFQVIGRLNELSPSVGEELHSAMEATRGNTGLLFNTALSYGGRAEIVDACRRVALEAAAGTLDAATLEEDDFARFLYTSGQPDPDLLIRTSGELRVSNFLLWQIAYAEIWVTETLWPDFRRGDLVRAILDYQKRERRYGGIGASNLARGKTNPTPALRG